MVQKLEARNFSQAVADAEGKLLDFSFVPITQYGSAAQYLSYESLSETLERFYFERERLARTKSKAEDLFKTINNLIERLAKKISNQMAELEECKDREEKKLQSDLENYHLVKTIENKQKLLPIINLCGMLLNIVLNIIMIPLWGAIGAAFASLLTQVFANFILGFLAMYEAGCGELYLAKARALIDQLVNVQKENGQIPTHWMVEDDADWNFWFNCMFFSCRALGEMTAYEEK